jgi:3-hydroxyacyl-[acyl-carrier-protein] dehydratase
MNSAAELVAALQNLPHGDTFRFVDRLVALEPGKSGVGEYEVRGDESFLSGHFPGDPLFPGVLLIEAAAQVAGVIAQCDPATAPLSNLKLTAVRGVKIVGSARPGEVMRMEVKVKARLGGLVQAEGVVRVSGRVVLEGELTLSGDTQESRSVSG